ncbi:MAG: S-layer homology domain-containing protein [Oscillospiraceae bacterium]|nr:S-layer homology domain-containing protein [Oscillospiraceae bacterium]
MKKHVLALLLALMLCVQLTLPAGAAFRTYEDVQEDHWTTSSVERAIDLGLLQGKTEGAFGWGQPMSRAEFAVALVRLFGWEEVVPDRSTFSDAAPDSWFYTAVETAAANGALSTGSPAFRPTDGITREEAASMLIRGLGYTSLAGYAAENESPFSDVTTNKGFITAAYDMGLMSGTGDGLFHPEDVVTRELGAAVLMRLYDCLYSHPIRLSSSSAYWEVAVETPLADSNGILPTTPLEPLTDLYDALREMKESGTNMNRVVLSLNGGGIRTLTSYGVVLSSETLSAREVEAVLSRSDVNTYYSERYESAYCIYQPNAYQTATVWYQNDESMAAKLQLASLFGVTRYVLR